MKINKKGLLVLIIAVVVIVLAVAAYFMFRNTTPIVWDGTYTMVGNLTCTGNFPNLTTIPMNTTISVSGNKIVDETTGKSFDIDKRGKVTEIEEMTQQDITTKVTANYKFSKSGDTYKYAADGTVEISTTQDGINYASKCIGSLTGVKK